MGKPSKLGMMPLYAWAVLERNGRVAGGDVRLAVFWTKRQAVKESGYGWRRVVRVVVEEPLEAK